MRARNASTTSTGDSRRAAISTASRWTGRKHGSVLAGIFSPSGHLLRKQPAVHPGRADIVPHEGPDAVAPRVAVARLVPFRAFRHPGMLEFIKGQVFRLAVHRDVAAGAETAGHREIGRDIGGVVPVVELLLDH